MNSYADEPITDDSGTEKAGGLGQDGTIPPAPNGVAAGHTGEPSNFEPEEDDPSSSDDPSSAKRGA